MNVGWREPVRRPFLLALAASLLLHLLALSAPGWRLPWPEDERRAPPLAATLAAPPAPPAPPLAQSRPLKPKPAVPALPEASRSVAPREPERPLPLPPVEQATPEAAPVPEEAPPVTVPSAPTFGSGGAAAPAPEAGEGTDTLAAPPAPQGFPAVTPTFADTWPKRGLIRFEITRGEGGLLVGQSEHRWSHDGRNYELRALTETIGLAALFRPATVRQESRGSFDAGGLRPVEFNARRDGKLKDSVRFDVGQRRIFLGNGGSAALAEGAQDLLSIFYQLGALPPEASEAALTVVTGRKVESYAIIALETLTLETPFGPRSVRHLRLPDTRDGENADAGASTEVWLDTVTRLPLKIRHRDRKGDVYDQTVTAIELAGDE